MDAKTKKILAYTRVAVYTGLLIWYIREGFTFTPLFLYFSILALIVGMCTRLIEVMEGPEPLDTLVFIANFTLIAVLLAVATGI